MLQKYPGLALMKRKQIGIMENR